MTRVHDFHERNAYSLGAALLPFWAEVYERAFPGMRALVVNDRSNAAQHGGIDHVITLASAKVIRIDTKNRERSDTGDVLLEYISNDRAETPGWMDQDLLIDYMAYAFVPDRRAYLFDWEMLRRTWLAFRDDWIAKGERREDGFSTVRALNENRGGQRHMTWSVAVPTPRLLKAVSNARIIDLDVPDGATASLRPTAQYMSRTAPSRIGDRADASNRQLGLFGTGR